MSNQTWRVTNNTTQKNLVVINASVDSDAPQAFYYDQQTTLLPFTTGNLLAPGKANAITVPDVRKDKNGYDLPFTFIIAEAETLAPVKAVTCQADLSDLQDIVIDEAAVKESAIVFDFVKNISAYPGSELATTFAALDLTDEAAVADFFRKTGDYASVTLEKLDLVHSYYNALPYGWAHGKNTTIYLYSGDYENNTDTEIARAIGAIEITNNWTLPLSLTEPDRFIMELKLKDDKPRKLVFSNGVFWDTTQTAKAKLSLAAFFGVPNQYSLDDTSENICTFLAGSVNGKDAFGWENTRPWDPQGDGSFISLITGTTFKDRMTLAAFAISIAVGLYLLVRVGLFFRWCKMRGNPKVSQKERAKQTEDLEQHITDAARTIVEQINTKIQVPQLDEIIGDQLAYTVQELALKTKQSIQNVQKMVDAQRAQLEVISARISRGDIQVAADVLEAVQEKLNRGTSPEALAKFREELPDTLGTLGTNGTNIIIAKTKVDRKMSNEEREAYDEAFNAYDKVRMEQAKVSNDLKDIEERLDDREIIDEPVIEK